MKVTIGAHGTVTPAAARVRAAELITAARTGMDLSGRGEWGAKAPTVTELGQRFLDEYVSNHCKPNTQRQYRTMVQDYILPKLGKRRVPDIQRIDVAALHHDMRGIPTSANRMLATMSRMFTLAEIWGMRPEGLSPCRNIRQFREERRDRFLSDDEYRRLGDVLKAVEREGSERPSALAAIRLLMFRDAASRRSWDCDGSRSIWSGASCGCPIPKPEPRSCTLGAQPLRYCGKSTG